MPGYYSSEHSTSRVWLTRRRNKLQEQSLRLEQVKLFGQPIACLLKFAHHIFLAAAVHGVLWCPDVVNDDQPPARSQRRLDPREVGHTIIDFMVGVAQKDHVYG